MIRSSDFRAEPGICLLMGPPAAGKSTLAKDLAKRLGGVSVSLGDDIRAERQRCAHFKSATETAMTGDHRFEAQHLAPLLDRRLSAASDTPVFLDAGPGVERALALLGRRADVVLWLTAPREERLTRFLRRGRDEQVGMSLKALFETRNSKLKAPLRFSYERLSQGALTFQVDASGPTEATTLQALQLLCLAAALKNRPQVHAVRSLQEAIGQARETGQTASWVRDRADFVLLIKPGPDNPGRHLEGVRATLALWDLDITSAVVLDGRQVQHAGLALAHLGPHAVYARFPELAGCGTGLRPALPARAGDTQIWSEMCRTRIRPGAWIGKARTGETIMNGHVPPLLDDFHNPAWATVALGLTSTGAPLTCLTGFRALGLGASDAQAARPGTLRHAYFTAGPDRASHANGFHCSASAIEAQREMLIWLDERAIPFPTDWPSLATRRLCDVPFDQASYAHCENSGWGAAQVALFHSQAEHQGAGAACP